VPKTLLLQSLSLLGYDSLVIKNYWPLELWYFAYLRGQFAKKRPFFLIDLFAMFIYEVVWRRDAFFEVTLQTERPLHGETALWWAQFVPEWFVFVFTWHQLKRLSPLWGQSSPGWGRRCTWFITVTQQQRTASCSVISPRLLIFDMAAHTVPQLRQITFRRPSHEHSRGVSYLLSSKNRLGVDNWSYVIDSRTLTKAAHSTVLWQSGGQGKLIYFMSFSLVSAWSRTVNFNVLFLIFSCLCYIDVRIEVT